MYDLLMQLARNSLASNFGFVLAIAGLAALFLVIRYL